MVEAGSLQGGAPETGFMKLEHINPFIEAVNKLFTSMLDSKVERGNLSVSKVGGGRYDITALIGLSGPARGSVTLSFPNETALAMAGRLLGTDLSEAEDAEKTVTDAMAEMANIVAGSAKTKFFEGKATPIELSLPNVVRGKNFTVIFPSKSIWIEVPFDGELGPFALRVILEIDEKKK